MGLKLENRGRDLDREKEGLDRWWEDWVQYKEHWFRCQRELHSLSR